MPGLAQYGVYNETILNFRWNIDKSGKICVNCESLARWAKGCKFLWFPTKRWTSDKNFKYQSNFQNGSENYQNLAKLNLQQAIDDDPSLLVLGVDAFTDKAVDVVGVRLAMLSKVINVTGVFITDSINVTSHSFAGVSNVVNLCSWNNAPIIWYK